MLWCVPKKMKGDGLTFEVGKGIGEYFSDPLSPSEARGGGGNVFEGWENRGENTVREREELGEMV